MTIKTVALIGASGNLGPYILAALQQSSVLQTTVLVRESSKSTFSASVHTKKIPDDFQPQEALIEALKGQDALVLAFPGGSTEQSKKVIDAAIKAGVQLVIPADYGSCDSSNARSLELIPLYKEKEVVRNYLIERQGQGNGLRWTSLITGHFFDYGLTSPLLGMDVEAGTANIFDGGEKLWSSTTRSGIGAAVRRILESGGNELKLKNKLIYIQQVRLSQNQLLKSVEKATGKSFTVSHLRSDDFIEEHKKKLYNANGGMNGNVVEDLVAVEGIVNGDWQEKETLANDVLGIEMEDLDHLVEIILKQH